MYQLIALEKRDGLLFYTRLSYSDGVWQTYALRPPWTTPERVSKGAEMRAICDHGFEAIAETFLSLEDLVAFVRAEVARIPRDPTEIAKGLFMVAPDTVVIRLLDRVENELLPEKQYHQAARLLRAMIENSRHLTEGTGLRERADRLLNVVNQSLGSDSFWP